MRCVRILDVSPATPVACLLWVIVYAGFFCLFAAEHTVLAGGLNPDFAARMVANCIAGIVLGFALIAWTLLRVFGHVSGESAAGLFLAGMALLLRAMTELAVWHVEGYRPSSGGTASAATHLISVFRHTGTFTYGVGLAFAVGACWADLLRPRSL